MEYKQFLSSKVLAVPAAGLDSIPPINPALFAWQRDVVVWALRRGRACIWADCGLGKTIMQLEWARCVPGNVLILTPLAVAQQTIAEASRFNVDATAGISRDGKPAGKITITNYEMLHRFNPADYNGIVLDESSILKSYSGKIRTAIIESFRLTPYRLACTATPAPNDHMEIGNHAEFVGAMSRVEMLATFFCHDGGDTSQWRLKGHAKEPFWRWVAHWAVMMRHPSDIGYDATGFELPVLDIRHHRIKAEAEAADGMLFGMPALSLVEQRRARRSTLGVRVKYVADMVNSTSGQWVVWAELNDESAALANAINGAIEVTGSMDADQKEAQLVAFSEGRLRVLVTKPRIGGFGMNWQNCNQAAFVGLSNSYEQFYQAIRRFWRFGQQRPVTVHAIVTDIEQTVLHNIMRKQGEHESMVSEMRTYMTDTIKEQLAGITRDVTPYMEDTMHGDGWTMYLGDCVETAKRLPAESVDYSVFSPPFASLYTYSASDRDMGNCRDRETFMKHFEYLVDALYRITKPGRLLSFHCMNLPSTKAFDGEIGLKDFRGWLIEAFAKGGWLFHSEVCVWKDPVTAMQRTKAIGLLWKQLRKDSTMSRQGIPDYVVTVRKPGVNTSPVTHTQEGYPVDRWQKIASPVWMDINPSDTLQRLSVREDSDERHIAPLQLEVIRRCIELWTNPGDLVMSPFAGIGSEGYVSLQMKRRFIGVELKRSYWQQAVENLKAVTAQTEMEYGERVAVR